MDKIKVLITGTEGQLGKDLTKILIEREFDVYAFGKCDLDITNMGQVIKQAEAIKPDVIIHSAAYTKVDIADSQPDDAYLINGLGTRNVARVAEALGSKLVYVSTDYVFDGSGKEPYNEYHPTNPINVYRKSRLAGELFVQTLHSRFFIIRTSWVYGLHGQNFVKTMLKLAEDKDSVSVVMDQVGSPTYTVDLAECISRIIQSSRYGIYHVSNSGNCSWYDFARAIYEESGISIQVNPVSTKAFPRPAKRPSYSVMEHNALQSNGFDRLRNWREALKDFLQELKESSVCYVGKNGTPKGEENAR